MPYFPMFLDLKDQTVIVVGGGKVAARKIAKLQPFGPRFLVFAPEVSPEIRKITNVSIVQRAFRLEDLAGSPAMVIAASNDSNVNHQVSQICRERRIPVNVVDDPACCTFLFPALIQQGAFCAGISTGGASPTAAIYFKEKFQGMIPQNLDVLLDWLEKQRVELKAVIPDQTRRAGIFRRMFDECLEKGRPLTPQECRNCVEGQDTGSVTIVSAWNGSDQITLQELRIIQRGQALVYGPEADLLLLDSAPEGAKRIPERDFYHPEMDDPQQLSIRLAQLAREGNRVVWLRTINDRQLKESVSAVLKSQGIDVRDEESAGNRQLPKEAIILDGILVGVTGTQQIAGKQTSALQMLGARTVWIARAAVKAMDFSGIWDQLENRAGWLVFTSVNGVNRFWQAMNRDSIPEKILPGKKIAVIGEATAQAWMQHGGKVDLYPEDFTSESLAHALGDAAKPEEPIWILRSAGGSEILPQILRERGLEVLDIPTYELEGEEEGGILPKLDFLTFSSASGVRRFFREYQELPAGTKAVCIGRITAMEFQKHSRQPYWLAKEISAKGLVMTIVQICLSK